MEDALLNRNRRNFVSIAAALLLVTAFGWKFPTSITLLGEPFNTPPHLVRRIAWVLFIYWGYQYGISFAKQIDWWRETWRDQLMKLLRTNPNIISQLDQKTLKSMMSRNGRNWELKELELKYICILKGKKIQVHTDVVMEEPDSELDPPQYSHYQGGNIALAKSDMRAGRFFATILMMTTNPVAFNLWLPWGIALATITSTVWPIFDLSSVSVSPEVTHRYSP